MDTRHGEERKGKSIKVPSWKCPQALWLQQHKESLVGESSAATCKRQIWSMRSSSSSSKRYEPLERWLSTRALQPDFPPHLPCNSRGTREKGMRMGEPCEWSKDRLGHLWSSKESGYHIHSVKEWESSYHENRRRSQPCQSSWLVSREHDPGAWRGVQGSGQWHTVVELCSVL